MQNKKIIEKVNTTIFALLYLKLFKDIDMIQTEAKEKYDQIINLNLGLMNSPYIIEPQEKANPEFPRNLYGLKNGIDGKRYAVIKDEADFEYNFERHIMTAPEDIIKASLMPNALEIIGITNTMQEEYHQVKPKLLEKTRTLDSKKVKR